MYLCESLILSESEVDGSLRSISIVKFKNFKLNKMYKRFQVKKV